MANQKNKFSRDKGGEKQPQIDYYNLMIGRYHAFLDSKSSSQKKSLLILWSVIALVLTAASVIPLPEEFRVLSALVGTPAGVILWFIFAGLFRETSWSDSWLAQLKENYSHAKRKKAMFLVLALFIIGIVFVSAWMPYGLGGVIAVLLAMFAFYFLNKTEDEKKLDEYGLPDPRDYAEFYEELEAEEFDEEFDDSDSDDIERQEQA